MSFQDLEVSKARIQSNQLVVPMGRWMLLVILTRRRPYSERAARAEGRAKGMSCLLGQRLQLINSEIGIIH